MQFITLIDSSLLFNYSSRFIYKYKLLNYFYIKFRLFLNYATI